MVRSHRAQDATGGSAWNAPTQAYPAESTQLGQSASGSVAPAGGEEDQQRRARSGSWGSDAAGNAQERVQSDKAFTWHGTGGQSGELDAEAGLLYQVKAATSSLVLRDGEEGGGDRSFVSEAPSVEHESRALAAEGGKPGASREGGRKGEEAEAGWGSLGARSCTVSVGHLLPGKALTPSLVRGVGKSGGGLPPPRFRGTGTSGGGGASTAGWAGAERLGRTADSVSTQESGSNRQSGNGVAGRAELSPSPLHVDTGAETGEWGGTAEEEEEEEGHGGAPSPLDSEAEAPSPLSTSSAKRVGSTGTSTPSGASEFVPSPLSAPPSPPAGEGPRRVAPRDTEEEGADEVAIAKGVHGDGAQSGVDSNGSWRYGDGGATQSPGSSPEERGGPPGGQRTRRRRGSALAAGATSLWREEGKEESPLSAALLRELDESPAQ